MNKYSRINDSFLSFIEDNPTKRKFVFYGGAGSGKSVFIAMFICIRFLQGQNENILVLRKWLPALKISALKLIIDILTAWGFDADKHLNKSDLVLKFGNNRIYFSGLDDPEKIKSAEFTYIWIEETTDLDKNDYMQLTLRLGRDKYTADAKILLSFNPIDQYHWLITDVVEAPDDTTAICHSTYLDNYDNLNQSFIDELEGLIEKDENYHRVYTLGLPGVLKNIIYTNYTIQNVEMPAHPQLYGLDFGFNNPMALIEVAIRDDSVRVHERFYERGKTTDDLIKWMDAHKISKTAPMYADSAEPDRIEQIRKAGYNVHPAKKDVSAGIDYVKSLNLVITSSSLNLIGEIRTYKYMERKDGSVIDEPVPFNDHCFVAGTMITTINGDIPIEQIKVGDSVLTRHGFKRVLMSRKTVVMADVVEAEFSDGTCIQCTPDHKFYVGNNEFKPISSIRYGDILWQLNMEKRSNLTVLNLEDTQNQQEDPIEYTTDRIQITSDAELDTYMMKYGKQRMEKSRLDAIYIILIKIHSIMKFQILSVLMEKHMFQCIVRNGLLKIKNTLNRICLKLDLLQKHGIVVKKEENGIVRTVKTLQRIWCQKITHAFNAESTSQRNHSDQTNSVQMHAKQNTEEIQESIIYQKNVNIAGPNLYQTNIPKTDIALLPVELKHLGSVEEKKDVYDITVEDAHEYFANGILVHNCMDALRYALFTQYFNNTQVARDKIPRRNKKNPRGGFT